MSWTEERVNLLKQLWGTGKSASEIAEILGGVSRNAVIGKAHRLGLSGRPSPIKRKKQPAAAANGGTKPAPAARAESRPAPAPKPPAPTPAPVRAVAPRPAPADIPPPADGGATIFNLTERMCRWPIGDPRDQCFRFCGRKTHNGLPYCAEHAAIAYQQPKSKQRDEDRKAGAKAG